MSAEKSAHLNELNALVHATPELCALADALRAADSSSSSSSASASTSSSAVAGSAHTRVLLK